MGPFAIPTLQKVIDEMVGLPNKEITLLEAIDSATKRWGPDNFSADLFFAEFGMALEHNGIIRDPSKDEILLLVSKLFKVVGRNYTTIDLIRSVLILTQIRQEFPRTHLVEFNHA